MTPTTVAKLKAVRRDAATYEIRRGDALVGLVLKAQGEGWRAYDGPGTQTVSTATFMTPDDAKRAYKSAEAIPYREGMDDDVTTAGVQIMRNRAAAELEGADLELIEGFRLNNQRPA